jgi:hypothetical protein
MWCHTPKSGAGWAVLNLLFVTDARHKALLNMNSKRRVHSMHYGAHSAPLYFVETQENRITKPLKPL